MVSLHAKETSKEAEHGPLASTIMMLASSFSLPYSAGWSGRFSGRAAQIRVSALGVLSALRRCAGAASGQSLQKAVIMSLTQAVMS